MPDREKVIRAVDSCFDYWLDQHINIRPLGLEHVRQIKADALAVLKEQEAVVRCKDCIHWDKGHTEECDNLGSICFHNGWCKPEWFCADGERAEQS